MLNGTRENNASLVNHLTFPRMQNTSMPLNIQKLLVLTFSFIFFSVFFILCRATMSDEGERTCPLCMEEMDLTDQQLKPCKCGYEVRFSSILRAYGNWNLCLCLICDQVCKYIVLRVTGRVSAPMTCLIGWRPWWKLGNFHFFLLGWHYVKKIFFFLDLTVGVLSFWYCLPWIAFLFYIMARLVPVI